MLYFSLFMSCPFLFEKYDDPQDGHRILQLWELCYFSYLRSYAGSMSFAFIIRIDGSSYFLSHPEICNAPRTI